MYGRVLHSTPPLHGGAITQIEPGITSTDGYFKPRFALDGDYASLRAYKRAMLQKYGSEKWQELQGKAKAMQKRLTGIEGRLQSGNSDLEKVAGLRLWQVRLQPGMRKCIGYSASRETTWEDPFGNAPNDPFACARAMECQRALWVCYPIIGFGCACSIVIFLGRFLWVGCGASNRPHRLEHLRVVARPNGGVTAARFWRRARNPQRRAFGRRQPASACRQFRLIRVQRMELSTPY
eukprot:COSAG05_NODE_549_length_8747_cov_8.305851_4_plen_236_part_00